LTIDLDAQGTPTLYVGDIMRRSLVVSLAVLAIVRSQAAAQTCQGLASYSAGQLQVAANAQFPQGGKIWGGSVSYGLPSGIFGGADLSTTSYDVPAGAESQHSLGIGAHAGYQMKLGSTGKMALCPVANLALGMGPDDKANDVNSSQTSANLGLALGTEMGASQQLRILPTAGLGLQYNKFKQDQAGATVIDGSETYALARVGVGFVFNQQISVRSTVDIPVGRDLSNDPTFGVTVGYNFGSKGVSKSRRH
jgi:outer membrane protein with beta-barrel domain